MNKTRLQSFLGFLLALGVAQLATAQPEDINRIYFTTKFGTTSKLQISEEGNTAKLDGSGFTGGFGFGYKLNRQWSIELGFISTSDFSIPGFYEGDDLDITSKYYIVNYTNFIGESDYFLRLRGGAVDWEATAGENFVFWGVDLTPDDAVGPYENSGVSPIAGIEWGHEFNKWIEWSFIGAESVFSGDAQWNSFYTSFKVSF